MLWPFDTADMTCYSSFVEALSIFVPFSKYNELFVESRKFFLLLYFWRPLGDPIGISPRLLASKTNFSCPIEIEGFQTTNMKWYMAYRIALFPITLGNL